MVGPAPHAATGGHVQHSPGDGKARVPGFPQDMWMPMDEDVTRPETYGLPKDWSASLGGMMTLVRVLPPKQYEEIMTLVKEAGSDARPAAPVARPDAPPASHDAHHR